MRFINEILLRGKSFAKATGFKDMIEDKSSKYEKEIQEIKRTQRGLGFDDINLMAQYREESKAILARLKERAQRHVPRVKEALKSSGLAQSVQVCPFFLYACCFFVV